MQVLFILSTLLKINDEMPPAEGGGQNSNILLALKRTLKFKKNV